jgi:SAM-dependent methyltransferase
MTGELGHPIFARFFDRFSRAVERELGPLRDQLAEGLSGRVLELGAGNGINFAHYPSSVDEVVAIEPEPYLRARAEQAAADAPVRITVRPGLAGELELEPGSFDAVLCSLVLCSVADPGRALRELHGLLRAGGQLRFLEHVRGRGPAKARAQRTLDGSGLWPLLFGGCHCSRDTETALRDAGFQIERSRTLDLGPAWLLSNPHITGTALAVG